VVVVLVVLQPKVMLEVQVLLFHPIQLAVVVELVR
jgi:hypothetical protein